MEWKDFGLNVFVNDDQSVLKVYRLSDLPQEFSFCKSLDKLEEFKVIYSVGGRGKIDDLKNVGYLEKIRLVKMQSKYGNMAYFDPELIDLFINTSSILYLPINDNNKKSPLIVVNADGNYIIAPYIVNEFLEDGDLDEWR